MSFFYYLHVPVMPVDESSGIKRRKRTDLTTKQNMRRDKMRRFNVHRKKTKTLNVRSV